MTELTGKQKRFLRGLGQQLKPMCVIGKAGLTDGVIESISHVLAGRELLKVRLPAGSAEQRRQMANQLAVSTGAQCVGMVGRTVLLYRPSEEVDSAQRISLP